MGLSLGNSFTAIFYIVITLNSLLIKILFSIRHCINIFLLFVGYDVFFNHYFEWILFKVVLIQLLGFFFSVAYDDHSWRWSTMWLCYWWIYIINVINSFLFSNTLFYAECYMFCDVLHEYLLWAVKMIFYRIGLPGRLKVNYWNSGGNKYVGRFEN